ncbi:tetraketide alpha-pyrone reductase 1 isoform X2 [Selaginella moellendorffii]|uniref:tetraketide alpha-pyrone reductase 1 isoform X2 n=1 Tax=Selaginella moellendorffii TaxID=88036 RepID=UPI000D1C5ACF|nr:tetraketide alpha-pyrone reductase 1 isoform X2 [Selaginella moellendorffii]|eukprot:XP_024532703.1 tetraketide alpha-pyrone reductase 1 isoform X2 [Selaginella moellendorffii]
MDSEKVCVTGASGFLASWLVKRLLEEGYYVVGTVRDPDDASKTAHLWELPGARERLDLKKADLITPGAFDDIVQGCHGVFHIAAAVTNRYKEDPLTEIVDPCVLGTLNVLNACKRSTTVKRVVCTSSVAAVSARNDFKPDDVLDESVWSAPDFCREIEMWYGLGKTLPEQAALEFGKENGIEVITIAPSVVGELLSSKAHCRLRFQTHCRSHGLFRSGWIRSSRRRCSNRPPPPPLDEIEVVIFHGIQLHKASGRSWDPIQVAGANV